ncbi:MAG: leucyl aminopeptidase [Smithellaceae bacterium]
MNITVKKGNIVETKTQVIILPLCEGDKQLPAAARDVDQKTGGLISDVMKSGDFEARASQISVLYAGERLPAKRIALVGLGKRKDLNLEKIRNAYAKVMQHLRGMNLKDAATFVDFDGLPDQKEKIVSALTEGAALGLYQYTPYKTVGRDEIKVMRQLDIVVSPGDYAMALEENRKAKIIAQAVSFARDLVSAPGNEMTPTMLAQQAQKIGKKKNVTCRILDKKKMQVLGMNSLLGVASGSCQEPKMIILEYAGAGKTEAPLVLVGKGLTFDTGGISLKPPEKMDEMKTDMAGGAAVLGAIMAAADLKLPCNVVGLVPATENMPGGCACKPGDILKSYSGITIEVLNTDAEGRLILADALSYASKYKPAAILDIATLTGACIVALGDEVIGLLGTDDELKDQVKSASKMTGELVWELPLWDHYSELIKSDIADFKNSSGRAGGTITAAAFLSKFVGNYPWAHLDIAGPAWTTKDKGYIPKGASGVGVRLFVEWLSARAGK